MLSEWDGVLQRSFERLTEYAAGRQIVIPLSAGSDSRLEAAMLRRLGYENLVAFSYGVAGNAESEVSRQVAQSLGIPWLFVPYTREAWYSAFHTAEWDTYARASGPLSQIPHLQDWLAVRFLRERGLIARGAVFVPGHRPASGAKSLSMPELYAENSPDHRLVLQGIVGSHYGLHRLVGERRALYAAVMARLQENIGELSAYERSADAYEEWLQRERHAKLIVNSMRAYEQWGYDWWLPLWDGEVVAFWAGVPVAFRMGKSLYSRSVAQVYAGSVISGQHPVGAPVGSRGGGGRALVGRRLRNTPLWPLLRLGDRMVDYWGHPKAWYGILSPLAYVRAITRRQVVYAPRFSINSLLVSDTLHRLGLS